MGPSVLNCAMKASGTGYRGSRPCEGRMPNTWFQPAGLRKLPMKSEPSATGNIRCAKATAAPPLLPPALLARSHALCVAPNTSLKVCEPKPNSGVLVFPTKMQPAARMRADIRLSLVAGKASVRGEPWRVGKPATSTKSLTACGMPCSHPIDLPRASCASFSSACCKTSSGDARLTMALLAGLWVSICFK